METNLLMVTANCLLSAIFGMNGTTNSTWQNYSIMGRESSQLRSQCLAFKIKKTTETKKVHFITTCRVLPTTLTNDTTDNQNSHDERTWRSGWVDGLLTWVTTTHWRANSYHHNFFLDLPPNKKKQCLRLRRIRKRTRNEKRDDSWGPIRTSGVEFVWGGVQVALLFAALMGCIYLLPGLFFLITMAWPWLHFHRPLPPRFPSLTLHRIQLVNPPPPPSTPWNPEIPKHCPNTSISPQPLSHLSL